MVWFRLRPGYNVSWGHPRAANGPDTLLRKRYVLIRDSINGFFLWVLVGGFVSAAVPLRAQTVVFVDGDATGPVHDGTSWCTAFTDLQDALTPAAAGTEIRVADGTYKPGPDRASSFRLKTGVAVLGGFAGCGALDPDLRDLSIYESVLSGDLDGDDVEVPASTCCRELPDAGCDQNSCETVVCLKRASCCTDQWDRLCAALAAIECCSVCGSRCENVVHVVRVSNSPLTDETAVLDGFTITGGFANAGNPGDRGAGIYMSGFSIFDPSRPTINNCRIRGNVAAEKGAGVANEFTEATFTNCAIYGNIAETRGAGVYNIQSSPSLLNCTVVGNTAITFAGGMWSVVDDGLLITIANTVLFSNADSGGMDQSAQMNIGPGFFTVSHTTVQGWTGSFGGTGNNGLDPLFSDAAGPDGLFGTSDDDLSLTPGSPAINTGDPATEVGEGAVDLSGQTRLIGCRVDRGAIESGQAQVEFDFDGDGEVTLADFARLQVCFDAALIEPAGVATCLCVFDADENEVIDLEDYSAFEAALVGP